MLYKQSSQYWQTAKGESRGLQGILYMWDNNLYLISSSSLEQEQVFLESSNFSPRIPAPCNAKGKTTVFVDASSFRLRWILSQEQPSGQCQPINLIHFLITNTKRAVLCANREGVPIGDRVTVYWNLIQYLLKSGTKAYDHAVWIKKSLLN